MYSIRFSSNPDVVASYRSVARRLPAFRQVSAVDVELKEDMKRQIKPKTVFPLTELPLELRVNIYSEALSQGTTAILRLSRQLHKEAHPHLYKSAFLTMGRGGILVSCPKGVVDRRNLLLAPRVPGNFPPYEPAPAEHIASKLALIQNIAINIDFDKLSRVDWTGPSQRPNATPAMLPPIGLLSPFLDPHNGSIKRKTCAITFENWAHQKYRAVNAVLNVLALLDNFQNVFLTFESADKKRAPWEQGRKACETFNLVKVTLEGKDALGYMHWHPEGGGYFAFHPRG